MSPDTRAKLLARMSLSSLLRAGVACLIALCLVTILTLQDSTDPIHVDPTVDLPELHTHAKYDRAHHHTWRAKSPLVRPGGTKPADEIALLDDANCGGTVSPARALGRVGRKYLFVADMPWVLCNPSTAPPITLSLSFYSLSLIH
jgi:hypothetical protein